MKKSIYFTIFVSLIIFCMNCEKNIKQSESQEISLNDRSGGVIAYCYQPMQEGIHQIYTINTDGSENEKLIHTDIGLNHHDWAPDGSKLAAVGYVNQSTWSIYVFNADGSGFTRLTNMDGVWDSEPVWSPNGFQIAFTRTYPDQNNRQELWIMGADGSSPRFIGLEGFAAKWFPDGTRFIFSSKKSGNYEIYTCDIDGSNLKKITETEGDEFFPVWSPDGKYIAFGYSPDGEYTSHEIYIMDADGTNRKQLTDNHSYDSNPRWSPDGSFIAFGSDLSEDKHWEIYVMNVDGSDLRRVTYLPSSVTAINPVWRPESR